MLLKSYLEIIKILLIYKDSFTYNLVHYVEELGHNVRYRNDKISLKIQT